MMHNPWVRSPRNLGRNALAMIASLLFTLWLTVVVILTTSFDSELYSTTEHTDFLAPELNSTDQPAIEAGNCSVDDPINCRDDEVFELLMSAAFENLRDVDFYQFGKPVEGDNGSSCHMAWRFKHKEANLVGFYKDYRSFRVLRSEDCKLRVAGIGGFHSGGNARKGKFEKAIEIGETVNGDLEFEEPFSDGKYLVYGDDGVKYKSTLHFSWSFLCALGEAEFLNRTLVVDNIRFDWPSVAEGEMVRDFRYYFDLENLKDASSVIDQGVFWSEWGKRNGLEVHVVEDSRVTPMKLAEANQSLIIRKFKGGDYWWKVCAGEADRVIQRPWHKFRNSRSLWDVATAIASRMEWDYDSVHVERGEKAKNKEMWPNLENDTSPQAVLAALRGRGVEDGRRVFVATDEDEARLFDVLNQRYEVRFLEDYRDLWDEGSDWDYEVRKLNDDIVGVEFDGYMRELVNYDVFSRGKTKVETFYDLTRDCKDGLNTC
ncbi:hypothetical protein SASPL_154030 [Salvia splendens]|uniref:O-fucosyltransferase family protein n=1 Tax=Salvia splendens TaxID=180675 RepID=A0A8X8YZH1_SALSN|nr:uncharacterized protein LOC121786630 [Salvia splendens]KAG6385202.1 hypothetical protein SASPL_154030 [Salvia splendens]